MDLKNLSKQQQYLILGALGAAAVLYGLFLLVAGVVRADKASREELAELTRKIEQAETAMRTDSKLRSDIVSVGAALDEKLGLMPEYGNEYIWATERVYDLIRDTGVSLKSVDKLAAPPLKSKAEASLGFYGVRLSAVGSYNELRNFLAKIETENPLISVGTLEISATQTPTDGQHRLRIDLYWPTTKSAGEGK